MINFIKYYNGQLLRVAFSSKKKSQYIYVIFHNLKEKHGVEKLAKYLINRFDS